MSTIPATPAAPADRNSWATPRWLFDPLHTRHQFTVDAAADASNTLVPRFWSAEQDGAVQSWKNERVFCNPPYGKGLIQPFVERALDDVRETYAVLLLPARTDTAWFQALWALVPQGDVLIDFLPRRVRFVPPPGVAESSPTEASILVYVGGAVRKAQRVVR